MTPLRASFTPMKRSKKYDIGEQKELIDVFLRVRPVSEGQKSMLIDSTTTSIVVPTKDRAEQTTFSFNEVFTEDANQEKVFERVAQPLVTDFLESDRNCFLFAYGNSNAGKTYTIYGQDEEEGILPRVVKQILAQVRPQVQKKQMFLLASFVEVYGESFYDLLNQREKLKLKEAANDKGTYFGGVSEHPIGTMEAATQVVEQGLKNRQVAGTQLNHDSSRSHSLFTIKLVKINPGYTLEMVRNKAPNCTTTVQFCIVDLAGSERAKRTQNTGTRLKEAGHINNALMTFRKCVDAIVAIQRGATNIVIPYRESKLTQAVRDFFIGQAKGRMIINISSAEEDFDETLPVLDFANTAKEVSTNMKRAGRVPATPMSVARPAAPSAELGNARGTIEELTRKLEDMHQRLYDKDVELANKEMEVRDECTSVMAKRLQEMEVMGRESVERARAFAEDKYEQKIAILSQFIQFQDSQPQQPTQSTKPALEELAAQMDANHWKCQYKELEQTVAAKDKTIKSLQIQLMDMEKYRKELESCKAQLAELRKGTATVGQSTPMRMSPIPKIVITPPKEDTDLDCEETLSDDDAFQQSSNKRAGNAKRGAAAHDSPYESKTAKRKRDGQQKTRKHADDSSDDSNVESASEDEKESRKPKKAVKKVAKTASKKTAAKKATKAPAKKKRKSEESVSDEMDEEEQTSSDDEEASYSGQKHKKGGGTLIRQKAKQASNLFREAFTPEKRLKKKIEESPLKLMEDSFDKENAPSKVKPATVAKRTLGRRTKVVN